MFSLALPSPLLITAAYKTCHSGMHRSAVSTGKQIINKWEEEKKKNPNKNGSLPTLLLTDTPVMLSRLCLAASPWHFHCLFFFLSCFPSYLTVIRVINCSIKASLRIQNTLDAQPLGVRVVQLLWRTRLLLASDNQHATLIERQMGLFMPASRLIERRGGKTDDLHLQHTLARIAIN